MFRLSIAMALITLFSFITADNIRFNPSSEDHRSVPAAIINNKKVNSIKIPGTDCIVNVEGEDSLRFDSYISKCLNQRNWLIISVNRQAANTF